MEVLALILTPPRWMTVRNHDNISSRNERISDINMDLNLAAYLLSWGFPVQKFSWIRTLVFLSL